MDSNVVLSRKVDGRRRGMPLVLLHGFPFDRRLWHEQVRPLVRQGFRVIRPDLRGHGLSPLGRGAATMGRQARDVHRMVDELGIDEFVLGGHSMGGYVALEYVRRHPKRVRGLILTNTRAESDSAKGRRSRREMVARLRREGMAPLAEELPKKVLSRRTIERRGSVLRRVRSMILGTPVRGAIAAVRGMAVRPDQRPNLSGFRMPALLVAGAEDSLTPAAAMRAMERRMPRAELVELPGTSHLSPLERPREFNRALISWERRALDGI